jgi:hypothetical protein
LWTRWEGWAPNITWPMSPSGEHGTLKTGRDLNYVFHDHRHRTRVKRAPPFIPQQTRGIINAERSQDLL